MAGPPVPDVATLRAICHGPKLSKDRRFWYVLQRRASIYLTWLLLHTPLRPNQITWISVTLVIAGSVLLAMRSPAVAFGGALCLAAHHLLDKVDGDVARFRQMHSIVGVYLDELGHALAFAGIFVGLGLHLALSTADVGRVLAILTAAGAGALAMVLARQHKSIGYLIYAQHVIDRPEMVPPGVSGSRWSPLTRTAVQNDRVSAHPNGGNGFLALARDVTLQLSDFSLMVLLVMAGTVVEWITGNPRFLSIVLFGEAALQMAVFAALVVVNLAVNVESEVDRLSRRGDDRSGESSD